LIKVEVLDMFTYQFDTHFLEIIDEWDLGWSFLLSRDPESDNGIFCELEDIGYSRQQVKEHFDSIKNLPLDVLVRLAVLDDTDDSPALAVMQISESKLVFDKAKELCLSADASERVVGVEVIMRIPGQRYPEEAVEVVRNLARSETDQGVLEVLAYALGHLHIEDRVVYLKRACHSPSAATRKAAAYSLGGLDDDDAIELLVELSADSDDDVRNWATFGIGTLTDRDTPGIRQSLYERLSDTHDEARHEAIFGLARRRDERVLDALTAALTASDVWMMAIDAAAEMADPRLYSLLVALRNESKDSIDEQLEEAIEKCRPKE
jgi:hypothetical protein